MVLINEGGTKLLNHIISDKGLLTDILHITLQKLS